MVFMSFSVLQLSFFVFADAILKNKLLKGCTKKEIDQEMMLWFRNSGDRKGGRTARARNHSRQRRIQDITQLQTWIRNPLPYHNLDLFNFSPMSTQVE